jgi:sec-independent protein translocase protein TatB
MFDIGWGELVVIGIVALIAIGPKELPGVLRAVGQWVGKIKRMASDFQGQFQEAMREAEVADLKKQFDEASSAATNFTSGFDNPLENAKKEIESTFKETAAPASEAAPPASEPVTAPAPSAEIPPPPDIPAPETASPAQAAEVKRGDAA